MFRYPEPIRDLYGPDCINYRNDFNKRMHRYVSLHLGRPDIDRKEGVFLENLQETENIIVPYDGLLEQLEAPLDLIAVSVAYENSGKAKNAAFVEPASNTSPFKEGVGKTGLTLKLLGVDIPYASIPSPKSYDSRHDAKEAISHLKDVGMAGFGRTNGNVKLLSSNMTYTGLDKEGKLDIALTMSEPMVAEWDLSRHISRVLGRYCKGDDGTIKDHLRAYQEALAEKFYLKFGYDGVFGDLNELHGIDQIYLFDCKEPSRESRIDIRRPPEGDEKIMRGLLERNPFYQVSQFWKGRNKEEHDKRAERIMKKLTYVPKVFMVDIIPTESGYPLDDAKKVLMETLEEGDVPKRFRVY